ncbi:hypothetical protein OG21DRAFT_1515094, partial [Imleria badia]
LRYAQRKIEYQPNHFEAVEALFFGTPRSIVLIETQLTVMKPTTRYHCMGTLELYLSFSQTHPSFP